MTNQRLLRDERGATIVEMAFALPAFIVLLWSMVQLGLVYRANSGIQHSLGQGARLATLFPTPTDAAIEAKMDTAVYGIGPGEFTTTVTDFPALGYKDLLVTYTQPTDLLLFPGPTINVTKSKRVWVASASGALPSSGGSGTGTGTGSGSGGGSGGGGGTSPSDPPPTEPPVMPPPTPTDPAPPPPPPPPTTDPTPPPPPPPEPTSPPTTPPPTTGNGGGNNGNGNGNLVCKKKNGQAC